MRPIIFYTCLFAPLVVEEINLIWVYFYLIRTYHDTDDRGIKNWIKAKIKTIKESLKKGDAEPVRA